MRERPKLGAAPPVFVLSHRWRVAYKAVSARKRCKFNHLCYFVPSQPDGPGTYDKWQPNREGLRWDQTWQQSAVERCFWRMIILLGLHVVMVRSCGCAAGSVCCYGPARLSCTEVQCRPVRPRPPRSPVELRWESWEATAVRLLPPTASTRSKVGILFFRFCSFIPLTRNNKIVQCSWIKLPTVK